jgi:hypothetical protein
MFVIGEVAINEEVAHTQFACDVRECKGSCCTIRGGRGAPLDDAEVREIESAFAAARKYLSEYHRQFIAENGMVEGAPGNRATVCIQQRDCVFVFYEEGVARCALEKAYINGETAWRKPLSCHLFPIRVRHGGGRQLQYEVIPECRPAVASGKREHIPLYKFLEDPLTRAFGPAWYEEFLTECKRRDGVED